MVGSIVECLVRCLWFDAVAASKLGVEAITPDGWQVEIKATLAI